MHVRSDTATQAVILARMDRFDLYTRVLGCETDVARGELIGMTDRAVRRARQGAVGGVFVANTLAALRRFERELAACNLRVTFEELFEVVVVPVAEAGR